MTSIPPGRDELRGRLKALAAKSETQIKFILDNWPAGLPSLATNVPFSTAGLAKLDDMLTTAEATLVEADKRLTVQPETVAEAAGNVEAVFEGTATEPPEGVDPPVLKNIKKTGGELRAGLFAVLVAGASLLVLVAFILILVSIHHS